MFLLATPGIPRNSVPGASQLCHTVFDDCVLLWLRGRVSLGVLVVQSLVSLGFLGVLGLVSFWSLSRSGVLRTSVPGSQ